LHFPLIFTQFKQVKIVLVFELPTVFSDSVERLAILWYNLTKKKFCFTTHKLSPCGELILVGEKLYLNIEVTYDRLGYSAQQRNGRVEVLTKF
jgi:hypothetical protein